MARHGRDAQARSRTPVWRRPSAVLWVAAGGFLGAPARYAVGTLVTGPPVGFPWATFIANVSGALLLGALYELLAVRFPGSGRARLFFGTGVLGSYTTFSTYMVETLQVGEAGHLVVAVTYLVTSIVAGLCAVVAGIRLVRVGFGT